jgi:hypothetical protein
VVQPRDPDVRHGRVGNLLSPLGGAVASTAFDSSKRRMATGSKTSRGTERPDRDPGTGDEASNRIHHGWLAINQPIVDVQAFSWSPQYVFSSQPTPGQLRVPRARLGSRSPTWLLGVPAVPGPLPPARKRSRLWDAVDRGRGRRTGPSLGGPVREQTWTTAFHVKPRSALWPRATAGPRTNLPPRIRH